MSRDSSHDLLGEEVDTARIAVDEGPLSEILSGPRDCGVVTVLAGPTAGLVYTLDNDRTVVGRGGDADILVPDSGMSRSHATFIRSARDYAIEDLGSTNGTWVDGKRIRRSVVLQDGARIGLGRQTVLGFGLRDQVEKAAARHSYELAMKDPLTGLYNRRHLAERLDGELAYVQRHGGSMSVLMVDIDRFKAVNDTHGHAVGDEVLRAVAQQLAGVMRREDVLARYGGEEFLIIARGIDQSGAMAFGERVREAMNGVTVPAEGGEPMTVSVGIAHASGHRSVDGQLLVQLADAALYAAKAGGRNRVELRRVRSDAQTIRQTPPPGDA